MCVKAVGKEAYVKAGGKESCVKAKLTAVVYVANVYVYVCVYVYVYVCVYVYVYMANVCDSRHVDGNK